MTIIDFYQELSNMLEKARSGSLSKKDATARLKKMVQELKQTGIELDISPEIFNVDNLVQFDDEQSYVEESESEDEDSSYEN